MCFGVSRQSQPLDQIRHHLLGLATGASVGSAVGVGSKVGFGVGRKMTTGVSWVCIDLDEACYLSWSQYHGVHAILDLLQLQVDY